MYIQPSIIALNCRVVPFEQRPDTARWPTGKVLRVVEAFTTEDGQWGPDPQHIYGVSPEMIAKYWQGAKINGSGGDGVVFVRVLDMAGNPMVGRGVYGWYSGFDALRMTDAQFQAEIGPAGGNGAHGALRNTEGSAGGNTEAGWCNITIGTFYDPGAGQEGGWCISVIGKSDVFRGIGKPLNHHVAFFLTFQETDETPGGGGGGDTGGGDNAAVLAAIAELRGLLVGLRAHLGAG